MRFLSKQVQTGGSIMKRQSCMIVYILKDD
jgi:hypothetical protein